jgi:hypothetical protein
VNLNTGGGKSLSTTKNKTDSEQITIAETVASTVTVDDVTYIVEDMSEAAKAQLSNIQFVDGQILQLRNEWAVSDTARLGYTAALKGELVKNDNK